MITKIFVNGPASFRRPAVLETDKKVNLIYGLNGSGKSTICRVLRNPHHLDHLNCRIEQADGSKVCVFNSDFVQEVFFESDAFKGIFSLSKSNKDAEERIASAMAQRAKLLQKREEAERTQKRSLSQIQREIATILETAFDIKRNYSGGDRVLEFCLDGLMGRKEKLFDYLTKTPKPDGQPQDSIKKLQDEA